MFNIGATVTDPPSLTIATSDTVGFTSQAVDPLQVEFIQPQQQTGKITCRVTDPKTLARGEAPWAEFRVNGEGHLMADVPPGVFPSTCSFAPGMYTFVVRVMGQQMRPTEERLGRVGQITVK
jgi:hypothetical protein